VGLQVGERVSEPLPLNVPFLLDSFPLSLDRLVGRRAFRSSLQLQAAVF
jgi:hypothetical protein